MEFQRTLSLSTEKKKIQIPVSLTKNIVWYYISEQQLTVSTNKTQISVTRHAHTHALIHKRIYFSHTPQSNEGQQGEMSGSATCNNSQVSSIYGSTIPWSLGIYFSTLDVHS